MLKILRDKELKKARGYKEAKSIVWADGREKLEGVDWRIRKTELWWRAEAKCERWKILHKPHVFGCWNVPEEPHHIVPRWKCRDDRMENLAYLSHACHAAEDERKIGGRKKENSHGTLPETPCP